MYVCGDVVERIRRNRHRHGLHYRSHRITWRFAANASPELSELQLGVPVVQPRQGRRLHLLVALTFQPVTCRTGGKHLLTRLAVGSDEYSGIGHRWECGDERRDTFDF